MGQGVRAGGGVCVGGGGRQGGLGLGLTSATAQAGVGAAAAGVVGEGQSRHQSSGAERTHTSPADGGFRACPRAPQERVPSQTGSANKAPWTASQRHQQVPATGHVNPELPNSKAAQERGGPDEPGHRPPPPGGVAPGGGGALAQERRVSGRSAAVAPKRAGEPQVAGEPEPAARVGCLARSLPWGQGGPAAD